MKARRSPSGKKQVLAVVAACMAAGMLLALTTQYARTYTLGRQAARLEQKRRDLAAENRALRDEIQRLQTDTGYIEQLAREQLGLVRPGEVELQVVEPGSGHPSDGPDAGREGADRQRAPAHAPAGWVGRLRAILLSLLGGLHRLILGGSTG